jgi:hypothetical protein
MGRTQAGVLIVLVGVVLIVVGLFSGIGRCAVPGAPCPSPRLSEIAAYSGVVALLFGLAVLVLSGWLGSIAASALAAVAAVPATWTVYEIARQSGCPLLADPALARACLTAYGEMTAPVLSFGIAGLVLLVGWSRWRAVRRTPPEDSTGDIA